MRLLTAILLGTNYLILSLAAADAVAARPTASPVSYPDELASIVVLCATEPGSANFNSAWTRWLDSNSSADVDQVINTVIGKARTIRSMTMGGIEPTALPNRFTDEQIAAHMRDLASDRKKNREGPRIRVLPLPES